MSYTSCASYSSHPEIIMCEALATVYYDSSYAPMEGETFIKTESIKKIVFGDNLTHIPSNICYNCDNLEEIVFSKRASCWQLDFSTGTTRMTCRTFSHLKLTY